mmetsp:Transcript_80083/g.226673  ORF Transcript_80083/g.226673 Transcript_80083/m.226673 type:complete len:475 (-) Transcript_80083:384-1808(-)
MLSGPKTKPRPRDLALPPAPPTASVPRSTRTTPGTVVTPSPTSSSTLSDGRIRQATQRPPCSERMALWSLRLSRSRFVSNGLPRPWSPATRATLPCSSTSCVNVARSLLRSTPVSWQLRMASASSSGSRESAACRTFSSACSCSRSPPRASSARARSGPARPQSRACWIASRSICSSTGSWKSAARRAVAARSCRGFTAGLLGASPGLAPSGSMGGTSARNCEVESSSVARRFFAMSREISDSPERSISSTTDLRRDALPELRAILSSAMSRFFSPTAESFALASAASSRSSRSRPSMPAALVWSSARCSCSAPPRPATASRSDFMTLSSSSLTTALAFRSTPTPFLSGNSSGSIPASSASLMPVRSGWIMRLSMARTSSKNARRLPISTMNRSSALASSIGSTSALRALSMAMDSSSQLRSSRASASRRPSRALVLMSSGCCSVPPRPAASCSASRGVLATDSVMSMTSSSGE